MLKKKFKDYENLTDVIQIDLADDQFIFTNNHLLGKFDTIIALNVVEHIENDNEAIQNCYQMLKPNGKLIILVPAFQETCITHLTKNLDILEGIRKYR